MARKKRTKNQPKVAIVHDYLREYGGAERVVEVLHEIYPDAPVYTAFVDQKSLGMHWQRFADWDIRTTWMEQIPGIKKLFSPLRILAPKAFADLDLSAYDVVISSSNAYYAKAVKVPNGVHLCYCHTPPRALYGYSTMSNWKQNPVMRWAGSLLNHYLRVVDYNIAQNVDVFIANSQETADRITKFYRRESTIVHPPIAIPDQSPETKLQDREYYLYVNRLAFAKHPDLAVKVCSKLDLPLKVVGTGPMLAELKELAGSSVEFLDAVSDQELDELYAGAIALLYPVEDEDFGMVPVEAMAHGTPVIAHRSGGPKETITELQTGLFFDELSERGLQEAVMLFQGLSKDFSAKKIYQQAKKYSHDSFTQQIHKVVTKVSK